MNIGRVLTVTVATFSAPLAAPAAHAADLGEPIVAVDHLAENLTNSANEATANLSDTLAESPLPIPHVGPVHVEPPADSITDPIAEELDHPAPFINPAGDVVTLDDQRALDAELEAVFDHSFYGTLEPATNTIDAIGSGMPANTMPALCAAAGLC